MNQLQWTGNYEEMCEFVGKDLEGTKNAIGRWVEVLISVRSGECQADLGDWVVKDGEHFTVWEDKDFIRKQQREIYLNFHKSMGFEKVKEANPTENEDLYKEGNSMSLEEKNGGKK